MGGRVNRRRGDAVGRLPASLRAAWGLRPAPARGPRPALTLAGIVAAAVEVASAEGIEAVAMSRIAGELGVGTMSLYRYVEGKDELLALMMDAAFDTVPAPPGRSEGWRDALSRWARAQLAALRRHPWVVRIPVSGPPVSPNQVLWFERGLSCLDRTGLSGSEKLYVLLLVNGFVRNEALLALDIQAAARASGARAQDAMTSYGDLLGGLVDPARFPAVHALLESGVFNGPDEPGVEFDFGLERILDGIAALVRKRQAGRRR
jgi:AcrR family transcriptional regulator